MTSILPCTCSNACQADSTCARLPRFQAHLDAAKDAQHPRIHRRTEACANHLGAMVVGMTTWAREQDLTNADLTVLTIEPPPRESFPGQQQGDCAQTSGLVFSVIHLGEPENVPADMRRAAPDTAGQLSLARSARTGNDQLLYLRLLTVDRTGIRALMSPDVPMRLM